MALIGTCHGCGRLATLFDVESAGAKLCGRCVGMQVAFAGEVVDARRRAWEHARPPHDVAHAVAVDGCSECSERSYWGRGG